MHKYAVDWLRQVSLNADAALAEKRWATAESVAKDIQVTRVVDLLRLFLLEAPGASFGKQFTNELIGLDPEYPVTKNDGELRLMAGLVMAVTFDRPSRVADAFALGIRAAGFPKGRTNPANSAIVDLSEQYLETEAARIRPSDFSDTDDPDTLESLSAKTKALDDAEAGDDDAKAQEAWVQQRDAIVKAIVASHELLAERIERLAEESSLLWWLIGEYSDALKQPTKQVSADAYALIAAAEAANRVLRLPPPPSLIPLLIRVLGSCKPNQKKQKFVDYVKAADPTWRAAQVVDATILECSDLTPFLTALRKIEELGSAAVAMKALNKACPGCRPGQVLAPASAAEQFFNELMFIRSLSLLSE